MSDLLPTTPRAASAKRDLVAQLAATMRARGVTKSALARRMRTSRSLVNRMLDPGCPTSLPTLLAAAEALGREVRLVLVEQPSLAGADAGGQEQPRGMPDDPTLDATRT